MQGLLVTVHLRELEVEELEKSYESRCRESVAADVVKLSAECAASAAALTLSNESVKGLKADLEDLNRTLLR